MDAKNIGPNLKVIMKCLGISQVGLAAKTGLSQAAISQIVNSERTPSLESVIVLLKAIPTTFERLALPNPDESVNEKGTSDV